MNKPDPRDWFDLSTGLMPLIIGMLALMRETHLETKCMEHTIVSGGYPPDESTLRLFVAKLMNCIRGYHSLGIVDSKCSCSEKTWSLLIKLRWPDRDGTIRNWWNMFVGNDQKNPANVLVIIGG
jgi:hypothetical protein